jgi:multisubunit Na+/H+ antiporter MnhE subunit
MFKHIKQAVWGAFSISLFLAVFYFVFDNNAASRFWIFGFIIASMLLNYFYAEAVKYREMYLEQKALIDMWFKLDKELKESNVK